MDLTSFQILSFDCYGTLIDWEEGIVSVLQPWSDINHLGLDRESLLESFSELETHVQKENPDWLYPKVLEEVARKLCIHHTIDSDPVFEKKLADSVGYWPAFSDTVQALKVLEKHYKLIILSNISEDAFRKTNSNNLGIDFYKVLTAESIGTYKPDPNNFNFLIEKVKQEGFRKEAILHVAQSLYHDMEPASKMGLSTVWINRRKGKEGFGATPPPIDDVQPDMEFDSMEDFAKHTSEAFG